MISEDLLQTAAAYVRQEVARGRDACTTIVADTVEHLHGMGTAPQLRALAWSLVGPAFAAHRDAQARWPERTDSDRLTDAFRALDAAGIVAREDFACCQRCGVAEIGAECMEDAPARGYVFYHGQDAAAATVGGGLFLAFGSLGDAADEEIGDEIAAAVRGEGLVVEWNGSPTTRLLVRLEWARRRHGRMAAFLHDAPAGNGLDGPAGNGPDVTPEVLGQPYFSLPTMPLRALTELELPWLPAGVSVRLAGGGDLLTLHREHQRLIADDGRTVGRFDGAGLLDGTDRTEAGDAGPGPLDVTFETSPGGRADVDGRPMIAEEVVGLLRSLPTRTDAWLSALSGTGGVVQARWDDGRLWVETPHPEDRTSTGTYASLDEVARMLTILADEDRVAVAELAGAERRPWQ